MRSLEFVRFVQDDAANNRSHHSANDDGQPDPSGIDLLALSNIHFQVKAQLQDNNNNNKRII